MSPTVTVHRRAKCFRLLVGVVLAVVGLLAPAADFGAGTAAAQTDGYEYDGQMDSRTNAQQSTSMGAAQVGVSWPDLGARGERAEDRSERSLRSAGSRFATEAAGASGPVRFRPPPGATAEEIAQVRAYVDGCNAALCAGQLSPTGRVSTQGALRADASRAAAAERARAASAGTPYSGHAGHVPDTTWTGSAEPPAWMDLTPRVNTSLGGQSAHYPVGYRPTVFEFIDGS